MRTSLASRAVRLPLDPDTAEAAKRFNPATRHPLLQQQTPLRVDRPLQPHRFAYLGSHRRYSLCARRGMRRRGHRRADLRRPRASLTRDPAMLPGCPVPTPLPRLAALRALGFVSGGNVRRWRDELDLPASQPSTWVKQVDTAPPVNESSKPMCGILAHRRQQGRRHMRPLLARRPPGPTAEGAATSSPTRNRMSCYAR